MTPRNSGVLIAEPELYEQLKKHKREVCFRVPLLHYLIYSSLSEEGKERVRSALSEAFVKAVEEVTETSRGSYITVREKKAEEHV